MRNWIASMLTKLHAFWFDQGNPEVKNYYKPQELVFKVDDGINRAVDLAVQKYQEAVGKSICLYQMHLEKVSCFDNGVVRNG